MCVFMHAYVCMHVLMGVRMYAYTYIHVIHTRTYIRRCMHMCMCTYAQTHTHT